jgi:hypothetical protein
METQGIGYIVEHNKTKEYKYIPAYSYSQDKMRKIWDFYSKHEDFNISLS